jgi:hypothetical protein
MKFFALPVVPTLALPAAKAKVSHSINMETWLCKYGAEIVVAKLTSWLFSLF